MLAFAPAGVPAGLRAPAGAAVQDAPRAMPASPRLTSAAPATERANLPPPPQPAARSPQAASSTLADAAPSPSIGATPATDDWADLIERAQLRGPVGNIARHASLIAIEERVVRLALKPAHEHLAAGTVHAQLEQRLGAALGRDVKVKFERDTGGVESPAEQRMRVDSTRHSAAADAVHADPFVRSLIDTFGARVIPESVRPTES
jgi:DNA polymerase-3 subunit gamma/tau